MTLPGTDYELQTTFWTDFSIADGFGVDAVQDTYNRAFEEWKDHLVYLTELAMVMYHKCWQHYVGGRGNLSKKYEALYYKTDTYAMDHLKGADLEYYWRIMD